LDRGGAAANRRDMPFDGAHATQRGTNALDLFSHGMRVDDIALTIRLVQAVQQQRESNSDQQVLVRRGDLAPTVAAAFRPVADLRGEARVCTPMRSTCAAWTEHCKQSSTRGCCTCSQQSCVRASL
jgi:hypothetical protein